MVNQLVKANLALNAFSSLIPFFGGFPRILPFPFVEFIRNLSVFLVSSTGIIVSKEALNKHPKDEKAKISYGTNIAMTVESGLMFALSSGRGYYRRYWQMSKLEAAIRIKSQRPVTFHPEVHNELSILNKQNLTRRSSISGEDLSRSVQQNIGGLSSSSGQELSRLGQQNVGGSLHGEEEFGRSSRGRSSSGEGKRRDSEESYSYLPELFERAAQPLLFEPRENVNVEKIISRIRSMWVFCITGGFHE